MSEATAYEIEVNLPDLPKGELVQIPGLGTFENGTKHDVSQEEAEAYRAYHTQHVAETSEDGEMSVDVVQGPTLLEASKDMYGVEVAVHTKKKSGGDN